jgi:hypothetical protein
MRFRRVNILLKSFAYELALKAKLPDDEQDVVQKLETDTTRDATICCTDTSTATIQG